jgi:hypothetical protein
MTRRGRPALAPVRVLVRDADGILFDVDERRRVTAALLREELERGGRFRAHREGGGADCTYEVLAEVLRSGVGGPGGAAGELLGVLARTLMSGATTATDRDQDRSRSER